MYHMYVYIYIYIYIMYMYEMSSSAISTVLCQPLGAVLSWPSVCRLSLYIYIYTHIHTHTYTYTYTSKLIYVYIYIYIEREREMSLLDASRMNHGSRNRRMQRCKPGGRALRHYSVT